MKTFLSQPRKTSETFLRGHRGVLPAGGMLLLAGLCAPLLLGGCSREAASEARGGKPRGRPPALIRVMPVREAAIAPRIVAVGTVTPKRVSVVASGADGVVEHYYAEEGEWVPEGAVLSVLRMESSNRQLAEAKELLEQYRAEFLETQSFRKEEVAAAEFRMQSAAIAMKIAQQRYQRALDAFKRNAVNENDLDDAEERAKQTAALYQAAKAEYDRLKAGPRLEKRLQAERKMKAQQEHIAFLEAEQAKRTTRAPFAGFVVQEHSYKGQWLSKGAPVATLALLDEVDVVVNVDQADIRFVQLGTEADVELAGLPRLEVTLRDGRRLSGLLERESAEAIELTLDDGQRRTVRKSDILSRRSPPWRGRVVQIVPRSDWQAGSRGFPVKVRLKNRYRRVTVPAEKPGEKPRERRIPVFKEGLMATVTFTGPKISAFLVPKDALVRSTQGMKINLFRPAPDNPKTGSTFQVGVKTGIAEGEWIQVIPQPAHPGERVVLKAGLLVVTEGGERLLPVHAPVMVVDAPSAAQRGTGRKTTTRQKKGGRNTPGRKTPPR